MCDSKLNLVTKLTTFRIKTEIDAKIAIQDFPTTVGLVLADVCEVLDLDAENVFTVLGPSAYLDIYERAAIDSLNVLVPASALPMVGV